jgi:hypothetical protein
MTGTRYAGGGSHSRPGRHQRGGSAMTVKPFTRSALSSPRAAQLTGGNHRLFLSTVRRTFNAVQCNEVHAV